MGKLSSFFRAFFAFFQEKIFFDFFRQNTTELAVDIGVSELPLGVSELPFSVSELPIGVN